VRRSVCLETLRTGIHIDVWALNSFLTVYQVLKGDAKHCSLTRTRAFILNLRLKQAEQSVETSSSLRAVTALPTKAHTNTTNDSISLRGFSRRRLLTLALMLVLRPFVVVVCNVCIAAKRCVLEQKSLLTAYNRKPYMKNRLVPK